jgi:hypothetical protein
MLQVNFKGAGNETVRFLLNTTFGLVGFFDIGKKELNIEKSEEDFGQTLGFVKLDRPFISTGDPPAIQPERYGQLCRGPFLDPVNYIRLCQSTSP